MDQDTDDITLPELSDARRDEIESGLFARIAQERERVASTALQSPERDRARAVRRGRVWMGAAAAAAFVAVAAVIAPNLTVGNGASLAAEPARSVELAGGAADDGPAGGTTEMLSGVAAMGSDAVLGREVSTSALASVTVSDTREAVESITALATSAGGYVESLRFGGAPILYDIGGATSPGASPDDASITVRVPADALTDTVAKLAEFGDVTSTQVDRQDVTTEAVDLRARVSSLEASVARLTELIGQAGSTADLIAAESALAERQGELDSLRQQLTWIEDRVALSTLTVSVSEPAPVATANPAGFADGVSAGWSGFIATLNGLVVAIGFLLPWLGGIAVIVFVVWAVRKVRRGARRTHRAHRPAPETEA